MTNERFNERIRRAVQDYHRPPPTPREEMWLAIEQGRERDAGHRAGDPGRVTRGVWWMMGLAAALLLGIAIGRFALEGPTVSRSVASVGEGMPASTEAYRVAAGEHLTQVETFLTVFRVEARAGRADEAAVSPARDLLVTTQLMLDSPAGDDVQLRTLLEDIELVLMQIALFSNQRGSGELELIDQGIEQRGVLLKLQTLSTAGGMQGAL